MNIGIYAKNLDCGGISRFSWNLLYGLNKKMNTCLITTKFNGFFGEKPIIINSDNYYKRVINLRKVIKDNDIDVMIVNYPHEIMTVKLATMALKKIKIINVFHTRSRLWGVDNFIKKVITKYIIKFATINIAVSRGLKEELIREKFVKEDDIKVIYNPIVYKNIEKNEYISITDKEKINIVMVGWIRNIKQQHIVIDSFAKLKNNRLTLNLIGGIYDKKYYEYLKSKISENKLENNVKFLGEVNEIDKILNNMDIFVLASEAEALPTVLIEAMEMGLPVISSNCEFGPSEILEHGKYGSLFEVGDSNKLSEIITDIINSDQKYNDFCELSLFRAQEFTVEKAINRYENLINQLK